MSNEMLSEHFSKKEMECRCCGDLKINMALVLALEDLRKLTGGKEITVNCAYRCPKHNAEVGGVSDSQHLLGNAADIKCKGLTPKQLAALAEKVERFNKGGIGIYPTFVHVDVRNKRARWNG